MTVEADSLPIDAKQSLRITAEWSATRAKVMTCQFMQGLIAQVMFIFFANQTEKK